MKPILFRYIQGPILIIAPHPDDDILSSGGLIQKAVESGKQVHIIYLTNGDANIDTMQNYLHALLTPASFRRLGQIRHNEALKAAKFLGVPSSRLYFFSFPDCYIDQIASSQRPNQVIRSPKTLLDRASYPFAYRRNVSYTKRNVLALLGEVIKKIKPQTVIVNHQSDLNPDHRAARSLMLDALRLARLSPHILTYLIHFPNWPYINRPLVPPANFNTNHVRSLELTKKERLRMLRAFQLHRSQIRPHLIRLIGHREIFWQSK